jgi:hypothetical protein
MTLSQTKFSLASEHPHDRPEVVGLEHGAGHLDIVTDHKERGTVSNLNSSFWIENDPWLE